MPRMCCDVGVNHNWCMQFWKARAPQTMLNFWGFSGITVTKSEDFKGALEHAIKANKPFVIDVHVDAEVRPPATGAWQLPPTPWKEPAFGQRFIPDAAPVK